LNLFEEYNPLKARAECPLARKVCGTGCIPDTGICCGDGTYCDITKPMQR
jgi:hypothetical protein